MNIDLKDIIEEIGILIHERDVSGEKTPFIIAVDGKSGGGKTTLASALFKKFGGVILHMDDFFLRPEQRTSERLAEIGGNVDYERFLAVLEQAKSGEVIRYQPYDCKIRKLKEMQLILPEKLIIVEGSYSLHPYFGQYAGYKIGIDIGEEEQKKRILERNGSEMLPNFVNEWIPKENQYLKEFKIFEQCNVVIK